MYRAIVAVRDRRKAVLVVTQPSGRDSQFEQERALRAMLTTRFGGDREVHYLDLSREVDVHDPELALAQSRRRRPECRFSERDPRSGLCR